MSQVEVNQEQTGLTVSGDIRFSNVLRIRRQGERLIRCILNSTIEIDLSKVTSSDTSGLSLLLRWIHHAGQQGKRIQYASIPSPLLKVATICGVAGLLGE